jgi:hypothetical protein
VWEGKRRLKKTQVYLACMHVASNDSQESLVQYITRSLLSSEGRKLRKKHSRDER